MSFFRANYSAKDFFDTRGESYIRNANWIKNTILNDAIVKIVRKDNPNSIIDLGAGDGQLLELVDWVKRRIAIDVSQFMLHKITDPSIEKINADIHNIPLTEASVDMITCRQVLHYCEMEVVFNEMHRVLKNKGKAFVIQITDSKIVPVKWYDLLKSFKGINDRKHLAQLDIVNAANLTQFILIEKYEFEIRTYYKWENYFEKNGIEDENKKEIVIDFFYNTDEFIKKEIDLNLSNQGISYNRIFSYLIFEKY